MMEYPIRSDSTSPNQRCSELLDGDSLGNNSLASGGRGVSDTAIKLPFKSEDEAGASLSLPSSVDSRILDGPAGLMEAPSEMLVDLCPVCNDKVSGYHYGLQTCESCKGFFKRSVQNQKRYACIENQMCIIDKAQRKRCPYCRFQKCLSVGMKLEAVRADRMRGGRNKFGPIYRRDRALRRQMRAQIQTDIDFQAVAEAAIGATLPMVEDNRMYNYPLIGSSSGSDEVADIKPDISELAGYSGSNSSDMGLRYPIGNASMRMSTIDVRPMTSTTSPRTFDSFQQPSTSKVNYTQDPLKGLSGMASAIVNQFIQQCDISLTSSSAAGAMHTQTPVQSVAMSMASNSSYVPRLPYRMLPPTSSSVYHQAPSYSFQPAESAVHRQSLPRYLEVEPQEHPSFTGPRMVQDVRTSPIRDVAEFTPSQHAVQLPPQPPASSSSVENNVLVEDELEASRVPMTLQLISDLRHSAARLSNGNNERLRRLTDELLQQTPSRAGLEGSTSLEDAIRWAVALACRVCDQALFLLVEWARQAHFFRQLMIEDQMKLLESCWSELLLLDMLYKQLEHNETHRILMVTGHSLSMDLLERIGLGSFCDQLQDLIRQIRCLKLDANEYTCLRFIILLNPDVPGLNDAARVEQFRGEVSTALLDYCSLMSLTSCAGNGSSVDDEEQVTDKFGQMLLELSEIKLASMKIEEFVYQHYANGTLSDSHLLIEMLLSSRQ